MNTHENYVSLETAKLLKQAGFDWECDSFYGLDVRYKGKSINEDEEYELKAKGEESKIEHVDGGMVYNFYHTNKEGKGFGGYSRPTLAAAQKWLREVKKCHVICDLSSICEPPGYSFYIFHFIFDERGCYEIDKSYQCTVYEYYLTYEEALEAGLKKCFELILKKKND